MTRPWGKLHATLLLSPKWRRLSSVERDAWVSLFLFALNSPKEDRLGTAEQVADLVETHTPIKRAAPVVQALVSKGWLDVIDGILVLHDWTDWQGAYRGPSDDPEAKRARMRDLRAEKATAKAEAEAALRTLSHGSHPSHSATEERRLRREDSARPPARSGAGGGGTATNGASPEQVGDVITKSFADLVDRDVAEGRKPPPSALPTEQIEPLSIPGDGAGAPLEPAAVLPVDGRGHGENAAKRASRPRPGGEP